MVKRGLLIGRFNPFHKGHLKAVLAILEEVDEIIIVIGSIQLSHSLENPFTAGERISMIHQSLKDENLPLDKVFIIPAMDMNRNAIYVSHIETFTPKFELVFSNNPLIRRLFVEKGYTVRTIGPFNREDLQGKNIRKLMLNNEEWEKLVPEAVVRYLKKINGLQRIKEIIK